MASPPVLENLDVLVGPIPGHDPAGESVPYQVNEKLEQSRKEINPADYDKDDPRRPDDFVAADWDGVRDLAMSTLAGTSKDLKVAARLLEALTKIYGFAGLRDGLTVLRRLVEEAWDRLRPVVETEDDLEIRAAPFFWLDDTQRGSLFPNSLRNAPVVLAPDDAYSFARWNQTADKTTRDKAIQNASYESCQNTADDINQAVEELKQLLVLLDAKMGRQAPSLHNFRSALVECQSLAQSILKEKGPPPIAIDQAATPEGAEVGAASGGATKLQTRDQIFLTVSQAAAQLKAIEPHSPVPYLLEKAIELGQLPFPDLMKALVRNNDVLSSMARELGIRSLNEE